MPYYALQTKDSEISLAHGREKKERDEPYKPQDISKGMTSQRGLQRARGHTAKKDLAAEEVLLGQQRLDPIACPSKTHYNQGLGKRNQGNVTVWRHRTVADYHVLWAEHAKCVFWWEPGMEPAYWASEGTDSPGIPGQC